MPLGSSLTGNFQKTNKPKIIKINDITQDTVGLLMLNSVMNIYLVIGLIFPLGLTFFNPSATITIRNKLRGVNGENNLSKYS